VSDDAKEPCYCAAHGCPLLGVFGHGKGEWWCFLHFEKDASKRQAITTEINRRQWLADAIADLRRAYGGDEWAKTCHAVQHEFAMQQRNDLKANGERAWQWIRRLENELSSMVTETMRQSQERFAA